MRFGRPRACLQTVASARKLGRAPEEYSCIPRSPTPPEDFGRVAGLQTRPSAGGACEAQAQKDVGATVPIVIGDVFKTRRSIERDGLTHIAGRVEDDPLERRGGRVLERRLEE